MTAIRAHRGEFGVVIAKGIENIGRLIEACERTNLPAAAHKALNLLGDQLLDTQKKIADAAANEAAQRLQSIPGFGPITASAMAASLPNVSDFRSGKDLSVSC